MYSPLASSSPSLPNSSITSTKLSVTNESKVVPPHKKLSVTFKRKSALNAKCRHHIKMGVATKY